jgi:hypothetical protein
MSSLKKMNDKTLMYLLADGRLDALEELYNRHWNLIYLEVNKRVKGVEYTEYILEKCLSHVWKNRRMVLEQDTFPALIRSVVKFILLNKIARDEILLFKTLLLKGDAAISTFYTVLQNQKK